MKRIMGTETEFGVIEIDHPRANPIELSARSVWAYPGKMRPDLAAPSVTWDYRGEDPLNDLRGFHLPRASADPSQLTDDPNRPAPSGPISAQARPTAEENALLRPPAYVLPNGGRWYVDHAHPEYSAPETKGAWAAALYDRAGEELARRVMKLHPELVFYKNNTDGKGASYGAHENYLLDRAVPFDKLVQVLTTFLVTRPLLCGAGRVGIGQKGQKAGFQISSRADFVENTVGLETTFNRPIINTRDEPHADSAKYRRLHVIGGDANLFDVSTYLRLASTSLVLTLLEAGRTQHLADYTLTVDPVIATWEVSHDLTLSRHFPTSGRGDLSAVQIQRGFWNCVAEDEIASNPDVALALSVWDEVLTGLENNLEGLSGKVEWVGKLRLFEAMRQRLKTRWDDQKLAAMDLLWADLRPEFSLVNKLIRGGKVDQLFTATEIEYALENAPADTRASWRGAGVKHCRQLVAASWTSLVLDTGGPKWMRVSLRDPEQILPQDALSRLRDGRESLSDLANDILG